MRQNTQTRSSHTYAYVTNCTFARCTERLDENAKLLNNLQREEAA